MEEAATEDRAATRREYHRRYYETNKAKIKARSRQWYRDNTERWKAYVAAWNAAHPERVAEYARRTLERYPDRHRHKGRRYKYGITAAEYSALLEVQGGACAICRQPEREVRSGRVLDLSVDHDHLTGAVRGLLCKDCNTALGRMRDNPERLEAAAAYLRAHQPV